MRGRKQPRVSFKLQKKEQATGSVGALEREGGKASLMVRTNLGLLADGERNPLGGRALEERLGRHAETGDTNEKGKTVLVWAFGERERGLVDGRGRLDERWVRTHGGRRRRGPRTASLNLSNPMDQRARRYI